MPYEVENKYRLKKGFDALQTALTRLEPEVVFGEPLLQVDSYFDHPDLARSFAETDEAFRIRSVGDSNRLTYKGPRLDSETKTRQEIEVFFSDGTEPAEDLRQMVETLGFRPTLVVRKERRKARFDWKHRTFVIVLDEVEGLGSFCEVETLVEDESHLTEARTDLLELAGELKLGDAIHVSYLGMLLNQREEGSSKF